MKTSGLESGHITAQRLGPTSTKYICSYSHMSYVKKYFILCTGRTRYMKKMVVVLIYFG